MKCYSRIFLLIVLIALPFLAACEPTKKIVLAGKVVDPVSGEWTNNRLVVLFLRNKEVGRSISKLGKTNVSGLGAHDGYFAISAPNAYEIFSDGLGNWSKKCEANQSWGVSNLVCWVGDVTEGQQISTPVKGKNVEYKIMAFKGDVDQMPAEIKTGTFEIREQRLVLIPKDGKSAVASNIPSQVSNIRLTGKETIDLAKFTIPINNCKGSSAIHQNISQSQTYVHKYVNESKLSAGVEIPIGAWANVVLELQSKYGYEDGQIDVREVNIDLVGKPGTNQSYVLSWREEWETGMADYKNSDVDLLIPFRVKTNLIYDITSQSFPCN